MNDETHDDAQISQRNYATFLNKLERFYLSAIRAIALIAATLLLIYAAWLGVSGLYKLSRDADSVTVATTTVTSDEIVAIDPETLAKTRNNLSDTDSLASERKYYADFQKRYHGLFKAKFEPFRHADDKLLGETEFGMRFIDAPSRLERIESGDLNFSQDKSDLDTMLAAITTAASAKPTIDRLTKYKGTKKESVARRVNETRSERYCSYYGYYAGECLLYDTRRVPVSRTVTELKVPTGIVSPVDLLGAYQDRYLSLLDQRRQQNASDASAARSEIIADNANGSERIWMATTVVGAFVILMFLFLLIALERHQRQIAARTYRAEPPVAS